MNYCTNCGNQVPAGSKFCTSCGTPMNGGFQNYNNVNYQQPPVQQNGTNGFAIAGLVCSLVVGSITGIIFSCLGLNQAKKCGTGKGLAIAGLIISILRIVFIIFYFSLFMLTWSSTKESILQNAYCSEAYGCRCYSDSCDCYYDDITTGEKTPITCPIGNSTY